MIETLTQFLTGNPLIAVALAIVVVAFVASIIKKLFKLAVVVGLILILSGGAVYRSALKQLERQGEKVLESGKELLEKGAKGIERTVKEKISNSAEQESDTAAAHESTGANHNREKKKAQDKQ